MAEYGWLYDWAPNRETPYGPVRGGVLEWRDDISAEDLEEVRAMLERGEIVGARGMVSCRIPTKSLVIRSLNGPVVVAKKKG